MISKEFVEHCPKCDNTNIICINQEFIIATSRYRKFIHAILNETIQCSTCGETWTDDFVFDHSTIPD